MGSERKKKIVWRSDLYFARNNTKAPDVVRRKIFSEAALRYENRAKDCANEFMILHSLLFYTLLIIERNVL